MYTLETLPTDLFPSATDSLPSIKAGHFAQIADTDDGYRRIMFAIEHASKRQWSWGMSWYFDTHKKLSVVGDHYGFSTYRVALAFAVTSPRARVRDNALAATWAARCVAEDRERKDVRKISVGVFHTNREKALDCLAGTATPTGPKVQSFADNCVDPDSSRAVTVDTHALSLWFGQRISNAQLGEKKTDPTGRYDRVAADFRRAAAHYGILPHQAQAIAWVVWRDWVGLPEDDDIDIIDIIHACDALQ